MTSVPYHHLKAYQRWCDALSLICTAYKALQGAMGTPQESRARDMFQACALRIDALTPPLGWRSWDTLGDAIHGPRSRPKAW